MENHIIVIRYIVSGLICNLLILLILLSVFKKYYNYEFINKSNYIINFVVSLVFFYNKGSWYLINCTKIFLSQ